MRTVPVPTDTDLVLVGGGLQSALIALAVADRDDRERRRPPTRIVIVEREARCGGNHTWSFHETDLNPRMRRLVEPLVSARWPDTDVAFPDFARTLPGGYATIPSDRLEPLLRSLPDVELRVATEVVDLDERSVTCADGARIQARTVIDCRGPRPPATSVGTGYQKFVGIELELARPHGRRRPVLMDARVEQRDGLRFIYTLPLSPTRILIEDTRYSDHPVLDVADLRDECLHYAEVHGWLPGRLVREEKGVLPIPWGASTRADGLPFVAGYRGGWFHPTTGYSLPSAALLADVLAQRLPELDPRDPALVLLAGEHERQARFCRFLNRLLFAGTLPADRWRVFARFYRLPADTIARFYALAMTSGDRMRVLCGRPPTGVSVRAAMRGAQQ